MSLVFSVLREANVHRAMTTEKYKHCLDWTPADWMVAMVGEVGEMANMMKKLKRGDFTTKKEREEVIEKIKKEAADIQIYLDLLTNEFGIDLGRATIEKFNEVSERVGSSVFIIVNGRSWADVSNKK